MLATLLAFLSFCPSYPNTNRTAPMTSTIVTSDTLKQLALLFLEELGVADELVVLAFGVGSALLFGFVTDAYCLQVAFGASGQSSCSLCQPNYNMTTEEAEDSLRYKYFDAQMAFRE